MEYKKELMEISRVLYQDTNNKEIKNDVDITFKQNKLMEILLKRIANQSLKNEPGNGLLKLEIRDDFFNGGNEEFYLIDELYKKNKLELFLKEYNMYVSRDFYMVNDRVGFCYKIIWDYKAYFEALIPSVISRDYLRNYDSKNRFINSISVYHSFTDKEKEELIDVYFDYIYANLERRIGAYTGEIKKYKLEK